MEFVGVRVREHGWRFFYRLFFIFCLLSVIFYILSYPKHRYAADLDNARYCLVVI